nr:hypothetical protein [uncultured Pseudomonas sp.]
MEENNVAPAKVQPEVNSRAAFIVLDFGQQSGIIITAELGPFPNWREATTLAGDLEEQFPGSVRFVHRGHGLASALPIAEQAVKARAELARLMRERAAA